VSFVEEHTGKFVAAALGLISMAVTWVIRTVFTNEKKVALLQQALENHLAESEKRHIDLKESIVKIETQNGIAIQNQSQLVKALIETLERTSETPRSK
jgi:hypothetical protein